MSESLQTFSLSTGGGRMLHPGGPGEKAVFIAENAISGLQWAAGKVSGGTTLDVEPGGESSAAREISLEEWVEEGVRTMIEEG